MSRRGYAAAKRQRRGAAFPIVRRWLNELASAAKEDFKPHKPLMDCPVFETLRPEKQDLIREIDDILHFGDNYRRRVWEDGYEYQRIVDALKESSDLIFEATDRRPDQNPFLLLGEPASLKQVEEFLASKATPVNGYLNGFPLPQPCSHVTACKLREDDNIPGLVHGEVKIVGPLAAQFPNQTVRMFSSETKPMEQCPICGEEHELSEVCPRCRRCVCSECYSHDLNMCDTCEIEEETKKKD